MVCLITAGTVHAQPPRQERPWHRGVAPAKRQQATRLFKKGLRFFELSQYLKALRDFRQAVAIWDHPAIRYNMAVCYINLQQDHKAYANLKRALRFGKEPLQTHYPQAKTLMVLLSRRLATLKVVCREPGAEVFLDGNKLFVGPGQQEVTVTPGKHRLVATKKGFLTLVKKPSLLPGRTATLSLKLVPLKLLTSVRRVDRYHWGWPVGVAATALAVAAVGTALLMVGRDDIGELQQQVDTIVRDRQNDSDTVYYDVAREKKSLRLQDSGFALLGLAGAAAVTAVVLWILQKKTVPILDKERPTVGLRF
jgi:tetratricopeptide (TPR) repeat protein